MSTGLSERNLDPLVPRRPLDEDGVGFGADDLPDDQRVPLERCQGASDPDWLKRRTEGRGCRAATRFDGWRTADGRPMYARCCLSPTTGEEFCVTHGGKSRRETGDTTPTAADIRRAEDERLAAEARADLSLVRNRYLAAPRGTVERRMWGCLHRYGVVSVSDLPHPDWCLANLRGFGATQHECLTDIMRREGLSPRSGTVTPDPRAVRVALGVACEMVMRDSMPDRPDEDVRDAALILMERLIDEATVRLSRR